MQWNVIEIRLMFERRKKTHSKLCSQVYSADEQVVRIKANNLCGWFMKTSLIPQTLRVKPYKKLPKIRSNDFCQLLQIDSMTELDSSKSKATVVFNKHCSWTQAIWNYNIHVYQFSVVNLKHFKIERTYDKRVYSYCLAY